MIPFEEKATTEAPDRVDAGDMPELIQNDINEGDKPGDSHDGDEVGFHTPYFWCIVCACCLCCLP